MQVPRPMVASPESLDDSIRLSPQLKIYFGGPSVPPCRAGHYSPICKDGTLSPHLMAGIDDECQPIGLGRSWISCRFKAKGLRKRPPIPSMSWNFVKPNREADLSPIGQSNLGGLYQTPRLNQKCSGCSPSSPDPRLGGTPLVNFSSKFVFTGELQMWTF